MQPTIQTPIPRPERYDAFSGKSCLTNLVLLICLGLSVFQIFVVNYQVLNLSLFWLVCLIALPLSLSPQVLRTHIVQLTIGLIVIQLISLLWSPLPLLGVNDTLKLMAFLVMLGLGVRQGASDWGGLIGLLRLYCIIALMQSLLVIALRIDSQLGYHLTSALFRSDWSTLIFEKNILVVFLGFGGDPDHDINDMGINTVGGIYNVYNNIKAGGFEFNGNIAGAWGGMLTFLSLGVFDRTKPLRWGVIVLIHALSIGFSGSKGSLFLMGLVPFLLFIIRFGPWTEGSLTPWQVLTGLGLLALGIVWLFLRRPIIDIVSPHNEYVRESIQSTGARRDLWNLTIREFKHTPLLGHGYGGWSKAYDRPDGLNDVMIYFRLPPHNSVVLLWTQSGMAALLAGLAIIGLTLKSFIALLKGPRGNFALMAMGAFLFVFLQSLFENINIFTNLRQTAPLALVIGMCVAQARLLKA